ncbi:MAG: metallophosphoesterase [Magnetococcales bacterium]|nr:metallophosphoesterase [Magnetococcales bacterium]
MIEEGEYDFSGTCVNVPVDDASCVLRLGGESGKRLELYPVAAGVHANPNHRIWILVDPDRFFTEPGGYILLKPGVQWIIGRQQEMQAVAFQFPPWVANRHLLIEHRWDHLYLQDLKTDTGSHLTVHRDETSFRRVIDWREERLRQVREIFGGPLSPLPAEEALRRLQQAHLMLRATWATAGDHPAPAILHISTPIPILVGDLHAHTDNLLTLLTTGGCLSALEAGRAKLIFLGDAVHPDEGGNLADMTGSLLMMDLIFSLMMRFPGRVVYLRGNHDGCDEEISKRGVSQGLAWRKTMMAMRGAAYAEAMLAFYEDLPYIVIHPRVVACHAAPFVVKVNGAILANLRQYPGLLRQLIWNRLHRPACPGGYRAKDVRNFLHAVAGPSHPPLVVGHTPLDDHHALWMHVGGIENHHILYGGCPTTMSWITFTEGLLTAWEYPVEPLSERIAGR